MKLNEIVGHLPHGLKLETDLGIKTLRGIDRINDDKDIMCYYEDGWFNLIENIKPILHPLSDLTKSITVDGKEFVPIEILLDTETGHNWSCSDYTETSYCKDEWWITLKHDASDSFGYNKNNGFYAVDKFLNHKQVKNQIKLFQLLYQWHFDIHGLIEKGEAIDINTLEN